MKKKIFALALAAILATSMLGACSSNEDTDSSGGSGSGSGGSDTAKVYLITMDQMDQHWVNVDKGCQQAVEELKADGVNIKYSWSAPDKKEDAKQIECVNNAVADGADVILVAANGPDAITDALKSADAAGVKIIYVDSPANFEGIQTLATDNKAAGKMAGEEMIKALNDKGVTSGNIGVITVNAATQSTVDRVEGFRSAFEGTDFVLSEDQYAEGDAVKAKEFATNFLSQNYVGLFGANEGTTVGVGNAIDELSSEAIGVGFDKSDSVTALIEKGALLCTMAQNPDKMGYEGMMTASKVLNGETITEKNIDTGVTVLTKDNLDQA